MLVSSLKNSSAKNFPQKKTPDNQAGNFFYMKVSREVEKQQKNFSLLLYFIGRSKRKVEETFTLWQRRELPAALIFLFTGANLNID